MAEVHTTSVQVLLLSLGRRPGRLLSVGGCSRWDRCGGDLCCRVGPPRPLGARGPSTQNCLPAPAPRRGPRTGPSSPSSPALPPGPERHTPAPSTAGRPLCLYPARQPRVAALGPGSRQVWESAVRGPLLLLDASPPGSSGFRQGSRRKGLSPPRARGGSPPRP